MTLRVYTSTVAYDGPDRLDVSRKGNDPAGSRFAPSKFMFDGYLRLRHAGRWDRTAVTAMEMRYRLLIDSRHDLPWDALLSRPSLTLCCYCRDNPLACHRVWLARKFVERGATYEGERE